MSRFVKCFRQADFLVAVVLLGISAVGLNAATEFLQLHFKKQAVPLKVRLGDGIPPQVGEWVQVTRDEGLKPEMEEVLGTDQYIIRTYVDRRLVTLSDIEKLKETRPGLNIIPYAAPSGVRKGVGSRSRYRLPTPFQGFDPCSGLDGEVGPKNRRGPGPLALSR